MVAPFLRLLGAWPYRVTLALLFKSGVRAWQLTVLSVAVNGYIGWLLVGGRRFLPGMLLLPAGLLDIFDGGIARLRGTAGRAGAFLDAVSDRVSDAIVLGALFWSLAGQGRRTEAALALASLGVGLLVSHVRAEGEAIGLALTEGLFQRIERYVALLLGLTVPGALLPVLILLTALGAVTVVQRLVSAWRQLGSTVMPPEGRAEEE